MTELAVQQRSLWARVVIVVVAALTVSGCGSKIKTYPVKGKVHFPDGSPLPGGVVIFVNKVSGIQSRARIQEDGSFELGTLSKDDGSVSGLHRVAVKPLQLGPGMAPEYPVARKYHSSSTSEIELNVRTDAPNDFDIEVHPPDERRMRADTMNLPDY